MIEPKNWVSWLGAVQVGVDVASPITLCWLLGTSVRKVDDFALDFFIFLGTVSFTGEEIQEHFSCLHTLSRSICCSAFLIGLGKVFGKRLYVSVSRAKQRLYLVGEERAFAMNNVLSQVPGGLYSKLSHMEVQADYVRF